MTTQPEALRLADWLDGSSNGPLDARHKAAAELRRLHDENCRLTEQLQDEIASYGRLSDLVSVLDSRNQELLEALKFIADRRDLMFAECCDAEEIVDRARAAIAKAQGGSND